MATRDSTFCADRNNTNTTGARRTAGTRGGACEDSVPVLLLGVSRSGTTLLKEMLNRHTQLAIPTESYFVAQLWDRHGPNPSRAAFLADIARLERIREWGVTPDDVAAWLPQQPAFGDAIQAVYRAYADARGKPRFGDKTPAYMQRLDLLERAFPTARYVHLVRDGRDAGLSFLAMRRRPRFNWARPRDLVCFACQWRLEIERARRFGLTTAAGRYLELRYEDLVADAAGKLCEVCHFLELPFEPAMLEYHREFDAGRLLLDHPKLAEPPGAGRSRWREQLSLRQRMAFEAVAGNILDALGYEREFPQLPVVLRARAAADRAAFGARAASWQAALVCLRRSSVWRSALSAR